MKVLVHLTSSWQGQFAFERLMLYLIKQMAQTDFEITLNVEPGFKKGINFIKLDNLLN